MRKDSVSEYIASPLSVPVECKHSSKALTLFLQKKQTSVFPFAEKGELFVPSPSYFDVVYLNPDRQAVVPCRVTVLSARVTLHREFPAKEIPANGTDIVYDMKRGFVYLQPQSDHQGVVYCKAEAGGKSQISVKYQLLYVEGKPAPTSA